MEEEAAVVAELETDERYINQVMVYCSVLYCTVLFCTVLYCTSTR